MGSVPHMKNSWTCLGLFKETGEIRFRRDGQWLSLPSAYLKGVGFKPPTLVWQKMSATGLQNSNASNLREASSGSGESSLLLWYGRLPREKGLLLAGVSHISTLLRSVLAGSCLQACRCFHSALVDPEGSCGGRQQPCVWGVAFHGHHTTWRDVHCILYH